MQNDNKITTSLTTVIIIAVCLGALILGMISYFIFGNKSSDVELDTNTLNSTIPKEENFLNNNSNTSFNQSSNENSGTSIDNNTSSSNDTVSTKVKEAPKSNPASVGEWVLVSKYSSGKNVNVPARVTNIVRGTSAAKEYENYCNSSSTMYKYEDAKKGMEWAIIEYEIDLTSFSSNTTISLDRKITGTGDNTSIKYNGYNYITSTVNMTSGSTKSEVAKAKFATQLPIGCTDYLIALGSYSGTQSFIKGK